MLLNQTATLFGSMIDQHSNDSLSELQEKLTKITAEGTIYAKKACAAEKSYVGLSQNQAQTILTGYLRFLHVQSPDIQANKLLENFNTLTEIFKSPLSVLRLNGLNEHAIGSILQYRTIRDAINLEKFSYQKGAINPKNISKFLLSIPQPANSYIRFLFLNKNSEIICDINRFYSKIDQHSLIREMSQFILHKDAIGVIIAFYTNSPNLQFDETLFNFRKLVEDATKLIDSQLLDMIIVGPASTHHLSDFGE